LGAVTETKEPLNCFVLVRTTSCSEIEVIPLQWASSTRSGYMHLGFLVWPWKWH
jgi:hypothetical protein